MSQMSLIKLAADLAQPWCSVLVATFGSARLKVLRMNAEAYPEETHHFDEGLLVLTGQMNLGVDGDTVVISAGELFIAKAGVRHSVLRGSRGTEHC